MRAGHRRCVDKAQKRFWTDVFGLGLIFAILCADVNTRCERKSGPPKEVLEFSGVVV